MVTLYIFVVVVVVDILKNGALTSDVRRASEKEGQAVIMVAHRRLNLE